VVARADLATGRDGPLLIDEYDSTAVVPPGMRAWLDEQNQIVMEPEHE
jgi:N-methylhydantoinase A/oxoprolinase/acetone carboxylase beta subunit